MDTLSRPTDIESFGCYGLSTFGSFPQDQFGDCRSLTTASQGRQDLPQDSGRNGSLPIVDQFMRDAPWDPIRANVAGRQDQLKPRHQIPFPDYPCFPGYRNTNDPSEHEDSGYHGSITTESLARQSVVGSTYGDPDRGTETASFVHPLSELHLQSQSSQGQGSLCVAEEKWRGDSWSEGRSPAKSETLVCPTCKLPVKTKAELNKHKQRHEKPFVCPEPNCTRKVGFGTQNDLARHLQSVHSADGIKYRCTLGTCRNKEKNWPRADNFKSHLKRVHNIHISPELDLSRYEFKYSRQQDPIGPGTSEAQVEAPAHPEQLHSSWMVIESTGDAPGPPSEDNGFGDYGPLLGLSDSHKPAVGHLPALRPLHEEESEQQIQPSPDNEQMPMGMGIHQVLSDNCLAQSQDRKTGNPSDLYQGSLGQTSVSPADLVRSVAELRPVDVPARMLGPRSENRYIRGEDGGQDELHREVHHGRNHCREVLLKGAGQGRELEGESRIHKASELGLREEDALGEEDEEDQDDRAVDEEHIEVSSTPSADNGHSRLPSLKPSPPTAGEPEIDALIKSMANNGMMGQLDRILSQYGYQKAPQGEESLLKAADVAPEKEGAEVPCQECHKKFKRPCELKKHMKRHEKPYACTHSDCDKRFGSKNDWKRHENSQHIQLEFWKCSEKVTDSNRSYQPVSCGKICHRRETFKNHLDKDHGITDLEMIDKRCTDCRNGRNFESRFWCGFCKKTIEFGKNGGLAWSERFDHIDAHFTGKNGPKKDKKDWNGIEHEPPETFAAILPPSPHFSANLRAQAEASSSMDQNPGVSRKRRLDSGAPSSSAKRVKSGNRRIDHTKESLLWYCCQCANFWDYGTNTRCVDTGCAHDSCSSCKFEVVAKES